MKIRPSREKKCICKHFPCTRIIFSTGRRAMHMYIHVIEVYYVYYICTHVKLLLSLLLLS